MEKHNLKIKDLLILSFRSFKSRPQRMILTSLGISVAVGMVFFLISLGYGLQYLILGRLITSEESLFSLETFYPEETSLKIGDKELNQILNFTETKKVSKVSEVSGEISNNKMTAYVLIKIIEPDYFQVSGFNIDINKNLSEDKKGIVVNNLALRLLNLPENQSSLDKNVDLTINFSKSETETENELISNIPITGIILDEDSPATVYIFNKFVNHKIDKYERIYVIAKKVDDIENLRNKLINMGLYVSAKLDTIRQAKQIMTAITITLGVFGTVALVVAAIGMFNVMLINFLERIFEVGIMKAIGATSKDIRNIFLTEAVLVSFFGGIGGILIGFLGAEVFNFLLNIWAKKMGGTAIKLFIYPVYFIVAVMIISVLVGLIAGFFPAKKAAQLSAREAFLAK
jgi:putative ABC transport system permease protein